MPDLLGLTQAIAARDRTTAVALTTQAIADEVDPRAILAALTAGMETVGDCFQRKELYVPEMLMAARAMKESMALLEPVLVGAGIHPEHTAILGTVAGDLHDIGKNLVGMVWKGANIDVIDLGTNVPPARFVAAAKEHGAALVGVSALLTTTMGGMGDVVAAIRAADLAGVRVIIGGPPTSEEFAREIGADGYGRDAGEAVDVARRVLSLR
jgi:5-methyltetrahydrofolate--homocysteine methyltransferase